MPFSDFLEGFRVVSVGFNIGLESQGSLRSC